MARDNLDENSMAKEGTLDRYCWPDEVAQAVEFSEVLHRVRTKASSTTPNPT